VFQQVTVDGTTLVVEFASDSELDQINLIQPNGELFGQREVAAGSQQVSFDLGTAYEPGEYEVFALRGEEEVGRSRRLFSQITRSWRWELAETSQRRCGMARKTRAREEAFVTLKNQGTGPDAVTNCSSSVMSPTRPTKRDELCG